MKTWIFVALLFLHGTTALTHSLKYFFTASSGVPNFPEFVTVGLVDEVPISHCDSNTRREEPKQDWMSRATEDDPQYWQRNTEICEGDQQVFRGNIEVAKQRFNQTGGVHIFQNMYGCEWDDETDEVKGYWQYGYDGEDFIVLNMETESWIAPNQQAVITKHKWDNNKALMEQDKHYLTQICPEWLKKYVNYGRSSLLRTDLPSVSFLQKSPSSPVSCHATGFYPDRAMMFWRKDGEEIHEDVDLGEILPNHDGTFQMSVDLNLSSVTPGDWRRYDCVFQLSGVKDGIANILDKDRIRTNWRVDRTPGEDSDIPVTTIAAVAVVVLVLGGVLIAAMVLKRKVCNKKAKCTEAHDSNSDVYEKLKPDENETTPNDNLHTVGTAS